MREGGVTGIDGSRTLKGTNKGVQSREVLLSIILPVLVSILCCSWTTSSEMRP